MELSFWEGIINVGLWAFAGFCLITIIENVAKKTVLKRREARNTEPPFEIGDAVKSKLGMPLYDVLDRIYTVSEIHSDPDYGRHWIKIVGKKNYYSADWFERCERRLDNSEYEEIMKAQILMDEMTP
jgi:hypothetical protein